MTTKYIPKEIALSAYDEQVMESMAKAFSGNYNARQWCKAQLMETISTSDFTNAYQNVVNYVIQQRWASVDPIWPKLAARRFVSDPSSTTKMLRFDTDTSNLPGENGGYDRIPGTLPRVPEGSEFPLIGFKATTAELETAKNGARAAFTFEAMFADRWDELRDFPRRLVELHTNGQETEILRQMFTTSGFNTNFFVTGTNLANNPALTFQSLEAAIVKAQSNIPTTSEFPLNPLANRFKLVVPVGLGNTARAIVNVTQYEQTIGSGITSLVSGNPFGNIDVVEVPWLGWWFLKDAAFKDTAWALVPANGESVYGPTLSNVFLDGLEAPELRIKNDAGRTLGGGEISPYSGSFDNDTIQIRVRSFYKGNTHTSYGVVYSKGDASGTVT